MNVQKYLPKEPLSHFVKSILVIQNDSHKEDLILPLYANGSPTLLFQTTTAHTTRKSVGHLTLYGQTVKPEELHLHGNFTLIAYFFHPYALLPAFNISSKELTDQHIDINTIIQKNTRHLQDQLLNTLSLNDRIHLINNFIEKFVDNDLHPYQNVLYATSKITESNGSYALNDIPNELNISKRTFQRLFTEVIGIPPKSFSSITQFQFAFEKLNDKCFSKLSDLAYNSGYADQSHFIRAFKKFTNLTPMGYIKKSAPYNPKF